MATVCMLGHPAPGHVNPNLPLMAELCRRGERVVYFATEPFRAKVERTGAEFRSYGEHALFERNLGAGGMLGGMAGLMETTGEILPALLEEFRAARPDYLLVEAHAVWGNLMAQMHNLPAATLCSMFAINGSLISARGLMGHLYGAAPRETGARRPARFRRILRVRAPPAAALRRREPGHRRLPGQTASASTSSSPRASSRSAARPSTSRTASSAPRSTAARTTRISPSSASPAARTILISMGNHVQRRGRVLPPLLPRVRRLAGPRGARRRPSRRPRPAS